MTFTLSTVARSLSDYLAPTLAGVTFYEDPNAQRTITPCAFLQQRYSNLRREMGGFWLRTVGLDLTYLEDCNLPDLQRRYASAAEALDLVMETFPYTDGSAEPALIRAYDRDWRIDLDALHYKFALRLRVRLPESVARMREMDLNLILGSGDFYFKE